MTEKKKKPKFYRQNHKRTSRSRIDGSWKRPRGSDNKKRHKCKKAGYAPSIGYGQDKKIRATHPLGKQEILVHNIVEVQNAKDCLIRISSKVGVRLKKKIIDIAKEKKLRVLNPIIKKSKKTVKKNKNKKNTKIPKKEPVKKLVQ